MAKKPRAKSCAIDSPFNPRRAFIVADSFLQASQVVARESRIKPNPNKPLTTDEQCELTPGTVLNAFACEVFLKCLLHLDKTPPTEKWTHSLYVLFTSLKQSRRDKLERWYTRFIDKDQKYAAWIKANAPDLLTLEGMMKKSAFAFEDHRYLYEKDPRTVSSLSSVIPTFVREMIQTDYRSVTV